MAATTPPNRRAKRKAVDASNPAEFDFDSFAQGFQRPRYTANIFRRADLVPRLSELSELIDDLQARLERMDEDDSDRGIEDDHPAARTRIKAAELISEFNELAQQYDDSKVTFVLRSPDGRSDHEKIRKVMEADGVFQEDPPPVTTREGQQYADDVAMYSLSVMCVSHDFTVEQWKALRAAIGEVSYAAILGAYFEAVKGILPSAPFSPKDLPSPTRGE